MDDINVYISSIIFDQVSIIQCERHLFYEVINRMVLELDKCENEIELSSIIHALDCFIKAIAFKENSIAKVIESCKSLDIAE